MSKNVLRDNDGHLVFHRERAERVPEGVRRSTLELGKILRREQGRFHARHSCGIFAHPTQCRRPPAITSWQTR